MIDQTRITYSDNLIHWPPNRGEQEIYLDGQIIGALITYVPGLLSDIQETYQRNVQADTFILGCPHYPSEDSGYVMVYYDNLEDFLDMYEKHEDWKSKLLVLDL